MLLLQASGFGLAQLFFPIAILVEYIIESGLQIKGINLPFDKKIYIPVLNKLKYNGISFEEKVFNI